MQALHHDVSPWQAELIGLRAATHAAQHLRQCHMRGRQLFMAHGVRADKSNHPGVSCQMSLFSHQISSIKAIRYGRGPGQPPPLWHGWCLYWTFFLEMPIYQIGETRRAHDSRPSSFETYCLWRLPGVTGLRRTRTGLRSDDLFSAQLSVLAPSHHCTPVLCRQWLLSFSWPLSRSSFSIRRPPQASRSLQRRGHMERY